MGEVIAFPTEKTDNIFCFRCGTEIPLKLGTFFIYTCTVNDHMASMLICGPCMKEVRETE